ncbi:MAG: hypothetical protein P8H35_09725 [Flavobacteriales bacterium]|nr:hypothetical protein [Flavobacteriales bacterium]
MRTLSALFILSFIFTISSCDKWEEKEKDAYYYYSTDFKSDNLKSGSGTILNINIDDIDILYTVFFHERKVWKYKLVAESSEIQNGSNKSDKVLAYEEGEANVDDDLNILFIPDSNPSGSYSGYFENDKKNFKVSLPGLYNREISFLEN